jgi:hypothetical protein
MDPTRPTIKGRVVEVDICEQGVGFVLSVGAVSVWLAPAVALDVLDTLARAVAVEHGAPGGEPERDAPPARVVLRRRIFS